MRRILAVERSAPVVTYRTLIVGGLILPSILVSAVLSVCRVLRRPVGIYDWDHTLLSINVALLFAMASTALLWPVVRILTRRPTAVLARLVTTFAALTVGTALSMAVLVQLVDRLYGVYEPILLGATHFAPAYSEARFAQVKAGASADDVHHLLGEPLASWTKDGRQVWCYAMIGDYQTTAEKGYHVRNVILKNGVVDTLARRYVTADSHDPDRRSR